MTENLQKFLETVSQNEELAAKISGEADHQVLIGIAKELGITLTEADLENKPVELEDDDLDTVAGGQSVNCSCALGGGGKKDDNDKACACVAVGLGYSKNGSQRCFCPLAGFGYNY